LKLALFTALALSASALVTFLTRPVAPEKLRSFHRKVRPGGWWAPVEKGQDLTALPPPVLSGRTALDLLGGMALCAGGTVGIGYAILLQPGPSATAFGIALVGAFAVYRWFRREAASLSH
jgi:hypothetical protein